jgi:hypothetical protein
VNGLLNSSGNVQVSGQEAETEGRGPCVLARSTYQELRRGGLSDTDIMAFAGELLALVATDVRSQVAAE